MKPERWERIEPIYHAALERAPEERAGFLDAACAGDEELRRAVAALLACDDRAANFIEKPALEVAARALAGEPGQAPESLPAPSQIGSYRILAPLGRGGMGEVYLALDTRLERKVALKLLPVAFTTDAERVRRFAREARAASALNHPNIITIHEIGAVENTHYIVTEYVAGETLRQRLLAAPRGRLTASAALELAVQIAAALAAALAAGITHRDIKPENVMVRPDGIVKVLDFGLAKLTEAAPPSLASQAPTLAKNSTDAGLVMGTPRYMSPEQARGAKVDARTDIFSLGVLLYELLAGRAPFAGATANETIAAILRDEPPPLAAHAPDVPPEMERILSRALRKDRDERYQTVKELLFDLKDLTEDRALAARRERSVSPESARRTAFAPDGVAAAATATLSAPRTDESAPAHTSSSAEYLVSQIKTHKRSIAIVLAVLLSALAAIAYFTRGGAEKSLAILPFVNLGGDTNDEYLPDGITETLINNLSQLPHLKVIARSSVFRYKGREIDPQAAGHELGVRAVLTGSVTQRGESLRISAELVDVEGKRQLWGKQYNVKSADIFAVQEEIARQISEGLRVKITGEDKQRLAKHYTENTEAYRLYRLGRYFWNKVGPGANRKAIEYFNQAIAQDPGYALAYAGLSKAYGALGLNGELPPKEAFPKAIAAALKAIEIDDQLAEAHAALAGSMMFYERDWSATERELQRALDLNANDPLTHVLSAYFFTARGRFEEAIAQVKLNQQLDPVSLPMYANLVRAYYFARRYDEAIETNRKTLEMDPNFASAPLVAGAAYEQKGMYEEAIRELQKANRLLGGYPAALGALGHVYAVSGKRGEALKILEELKEMSKQRHVSPLDLAILYSGLGDKEQALEQLGKAYEERSGWLINLKVEPRFDSLGSEPRFQDLLRRVGHTR